MTLSDRLRSRLGPKAAALLILACGAGTTVLAPSAPAQATTAHPPSMRFVHLSPAAAGPGHGGRANGYGHIWNSDGQCLDANSNYRGQNGDPIQLWACNNHGEQTWPKARRLN